MRSHDYQVVLYSATKFSRTLVIAAPSETLVREYCRLKYPLYSINSIKIIDYGQKENL